MRSTPVGVVLINDERPHVVETNEEDNLAGVRRWAEAIRARLGGEDAAPELVLGTETVKSVRTAQQVGEQLRRAGCRSVVMVYRVWDFPYLVWPFLNTVGRDMPPLSLSNNEGAFPGHVGL